MDSSHSTHPQEPVVELKDVSFTYASGDGTGGLHHINLSLAAGECVALCGMSGCGKTTLTRVVNGLAPHYYEGELSGQVCVGGIDVPHAELYETAGTIGSVFQNPRTQFFTVDVTSELAFGCENRGIEATEIERRVAEVSDEMGMMLLMGRSIFELSGGEKQKVACASVATLYPDVMVLDEPSSNLDIDAIDELRRCIVAWKAQGKTILVAEHRLHYLKDVADRVLYMADGRIVESLSWEAFEALTPEERAARGLRIADLALLRSEVLASPETPSPTTEHVSTGQRRPVGLKPEDLKQNLVSVLGLHFAYPGRPPVLSMDSVTVPRGSVCAVVGGNGAGKSTFSRCLCGLQRHARGVLYLDGRGYRPWSRRRKTFMVMQDVNHQLFTQSVLDEVLLSMAHPNEEQADRILEELGLLAYRDAHPLSLSGGQKQRAAIASAVASEREVLVFDEPTSGLDLHHMEQVAQTVRSLQQAGKTVFVVTHDPEFILACCTHAIRLEHGDVVEDYALTPSGKKRLIRYFTDNTWAALPS